jgi:hypothetical protein
MKAMLLAARHDIELHRYGSSSTLKAVLDYARSFTPLEVAMEKAGKRRLQVFPPYYLGFECSVPALLDVVARQVRVDTERRTNPFYDFLKAAEDVRSFYRELSKTDFENTLLQKWVIDSLMAAARVHWAIVVSPPTGTEAYIDDVDESLRWLVSWVSAFFPEREKPYGYHLSEAADSLACLGISLIEHNRIESAEGCASTIERITTNIAALKPEPYAIADLHARLETIARAADALGKAPVAVTIRGMIQRPATVSDADWPRFLEARRNRIDQLDRSLRDRRNPYGLRDDPVSELQRILNTDRA